MKNKLNVSKGNVKLGGIYNLNVTPIVTCIKCACNKACYSMKAMRLYPSARKAWKENLDLYKKDPIDYFNQLQDFLEDKKPDYFRFHSAGDIVDLQYARQMISIAKAFPKTKFLCFTKKYDYITELHHYIPNNLCFIASAWKGLEIPKGIQDNFPISWVYWNKDIDARIPTKGIFKCPGDCQECGKMCWKVKKSKRNILFIKH